MNWYKKAKKEECKGWMAVRFPKQIANKIQKWGKDNIPSNILYTKEDHGRETDIHVTIMYGICSDEVELVKEILKDFKSVKIKLGKVGFFKKSDDFDVVIIKIESNDLREIHRKIKIGLNVEESFPIYKPHCCIAYVKNGEGSQFASDDIFEGEELTFNEILFKDNNDVEHFIKGG